MKVLKKIVLGLAAPVVALGGLALAGAANAAPLAYADTSVQILPGQHVDAITGIGATENSLALPQTGVSVSPNLPNVQFSAHDSLGSPLTWSVSPASVDGYSVSIGSSSGALTVAHTGPAVPFVNPAVVTVKATDGTAVALDTLKVTLHFTGTTVTSVDLADSPDTVTLSGANNNATGHVDFTTVPASGVNLALANSPSGAALSGNSLVGTDAVPSLYDNLRVTSSDAGGAVALDTFNVGIKGHLVLVPPPAPTTPFVYAGHILTGDSHNATVGWKDGIPDNDAAWMMGKVNGHVNHCVEVFVYGFDRPAGTAHVGFTCDNGNPLANVGYLRGLAPGHTYALFVQPATGTYGNNHPIPGTNPQAHITVITPAA